MLFTIHPVDPQEKYIKQVADIIRKGGIGIFPTDTVYAMGCDLYQHKAVERIARLKGIKPEKANFSLLTDGLSNLSEFTRPMGNNIFRLMKKALPGAYTFILPANSNVPSIFETKKKTIGFRVPDNKILQMIIAELGHPLVSTSLHSDKDDYLEYVINAELIYEKYENLVDFVVDGGNCGIEPSTVLDCTGEDVEIIREGKGSIDIL